MFSVCRLLPVFAALALVACQETATSPLAGSGRLVLSPEAAGVVIALDRDVGQLRFERFMAVDDQTGQWGATFCEENAPAECIPGVDGPVGSDAVNLCRKKGGGDCRVLYARGVIVWEGPVLRRGKDVDGVLPFHGAWPVDISWPGQVTGTGRLIAASGRYTLTGFRPLNDCALRIGWTESGDPAIQVNCADGAKVGGLLQSRTKGELEYIGRTPTGETLRITIRTGDGTALPAAFRKRSPA